MRKVKGFGDFHVHTRVSGCCKEDYGIKEAWLVAQERGAAAIGITDHDVPFKNGYMKGHRAVTNELDGVYLGIEVSIRSETGKIAVSKEILGMVDYYTISEHVHIMPFWTLMKQTRKGFRSWWKDDSKRHKVEKFYKKHAAMTVNALRRNDADVLTHPWRFPWHPGILDVATIEVSLPVLDEIARKGMHIELSERVLGLVQREIDGEGPQHPDLLPWKGIFEHRIAGAPEFFSLYFQEVTSRGIGIVLGSDAHRLADVANFEGIEGQLKAMHLDPGKISREPFMRP